MAMIPEIGQASPVNILRVHQKIARKKRKEKKKALNSASIGLFFTEIVDPIACHAHL